MKCRCGYRPKGRIIKSKLYNNSIFLYEDLIDHIEHNHIWKLTPIEFMKKTK